MVNELPDGVTETQILQTTLKEIVAGDLMIYDNGVRATALL